MEHPAGVDQAVIHLELGQAGIGAGLAGKAEFPVPISIQRDERHGGKGSGVFYDAAGLNAAVGGGLNEQGATMVGMRKPLSILHSSAYANDCASQERPRRLFRPVLFFAMILPALQGSAAASALRCSMERMIPSSVLLLSWSSSFFTAKLLVPVRRMMCPR